MTTQHLAIPRPRPVPVLTSTVLAVVMRVAGPVPTEVHPHAIGHPEQQVTARIGDAVVYLTEPTVAGRIRQQWDATQYLAATRLPERISQTWLAPHTYPLGVALRLTGAVGVATQWVEGHRETRTPPHLRMRIDRLVWQVCDRQAWQRIAQSWFDAQQSSPGSCQAPTVGCTSMRAFAPIMHLVCARERPAFDYPMNGARSQR